MGKKERHNKNNDSRKSKKSMEQDITNNITTEVPENEKPSSQVEAENSEKEAQAVEDSSVNPKNVKERLRSFRRNKILCYIAAATVAVIVAVGVFCIVGRSYNVENRRDIRLVCADTTFAKALQGRDSLKVDAKDTITLQKDSTVVLATIQKIKGSKDSAASGAKVDPVDIRLSVQVTPAEDVQTTMAVGLPLLLCLVVALIVFIVAYEMIYIKRLPEVCSMMDAKDADELIKKIKGLEEERDTIKEENEELKTSISNKEREIDGLKNAIKQSPKQPDVVQSVVTIDQIRGIHNLNDVQCTDDAIRRIAQLADSKEFSDKFISTLNGLLPSNAQITLENYTLIIPYLKKDSDVSKIIEKTIDLDQLIRNYGTNNMKDIWTECGKDEKKFFEVVAQRIKPQQEYTQKDFLKQLKDNGFNELIVDNTTVKSLWEKVRSHFEQLKTAGEKALAEQKDKEIDAVQADLDSLKEKSKALLDKIKTRAKNDFSIDLAEIDNASSAFDTFCNEFKSNKNDLAVVSKLKEIIGLSNAEEINKKTVKNDIKNAVARELINGCSYLEGVENYDGIMPQLNKIGSQIAEAEQRAEQAEKRVADEQTAINDAYKVVFDGDLTADKMENSFSQFKDKAKETIDGLKGDVAEKEKTITEAKDWITKQRTQIDELENKITANKEQIKGYSDKFVIKLQQDVTAVKKAVKDNKFLGKTLMDGGFASKLDIIYATVENGANQLLDKSQELTAREDAKPEDTFKEVQEFLRHEVDDASGFINLIAQYYAYSRLPFMSDPEAEYGLQFNRAGIKQIYEAVVRMLADFNITLQVPTLYAEYDNEWDYENVTGQNGVRKGLDFLIPDAANHVYNVDNSKKDGLILDFMEVGYSVDGQMEKLTKIIL